MSEARALGINLSATLEEPLRDLVDRARETRWLAENADALTSANTFLERHGLSRDGLRLEPVAAFFRKSEGRLGRDHDLEC